MREVFNNIMLFSLLLLVALLLILLTVVTIVPPQFQAMYQSVINNKYQHLITTPSPKIIIIGGSNAAFGIDSDLMQNRLGIPCVNMALHAAFGIKFEANIAKANIGKGDIVIVAYEDSAWDRFSRPMYDLLISGIDTNISSILISQLKTSE